MYRRYSPQNSFPQNTNRSDRPNPNNALLPSPGIPKGQWDGKRRQNAENSPPQAHAHKNENGPHNHQPPHHSPIENEHNSHAHTQTHREHTSEQNHQKRDYRHAALNVGRQPESLNFQPREEHRHTPPPPPPKKKNPLLGFLPPSVYNPDTKKIFGFLEAEDLLLAALILMMLENEEQENSLLVYALLYILLGDKIDISKFGF